MRMKHSRSERIEFVKRWSESGLSAKEFAAQVGVNPHSLRSWRQRLRTKSALKDVSKSNMLQYTTVRNNNYGFVEIVAPEMESRPSIHAQHSTEPLELILESGIRIRIPTHFDADSLKRIVNILESR